MHIKCLPGLLSILATCLSSGLFAQDNSAAKMSLPERVPDEFTYRATGNPDRIVLTWASEPATSQAVTWRTSTRVTTAFAQIAPAGHGPLFVDHMTQHTATTTAFTSNLGKAHYHSHNFTQLKPSTKYVYRVGDGTNWSEWSHFTTASQDPQPFSFVYFGDAQNDLKSHWSRVVREAYRDLPRAAFLLHAGDLVNRAESDAEWGDWFYANGFITRTTPCLAIPGNHEYAKGTNPDTGESMRTLSRHWQPTFAFPTNGPDRAREAAWWVDYQGTRFVGLNSNEDHETQAKWLEHVLADNPNRWTVVTFHHPIYSSKVGRDNPELRSLWQPMFDKYRVDIVLNGHDHTYARTRLMTTGSEQNLPAGKRRQDPDAGTVYVVSVSGPKMYELGRRPFMQRAAEDTQLYQLITIDGDELRYEARTVMGTPYDAFTLRKREGQANELIERIPDIRERVRAPEAKAAANEIMRRSADNVALVTPVARLTNTGAQDQDDLCIWRDAENPGRSTVITSDKSANRVFVYGLDGSLLQAIEVPKPGNIDLRSGFPLAGRKVDLVVVNQREGGERLCTFRVDPESRKLVRTDQGEIKFDSGYGGCLYHAKDSERFYFIKTSKDAETEQIELSDDGSGHVVGRTVRTWKMGMSEGAVADDATGTIYIAEEARGIWKFDADPEVPAAGKLVVEVGTNDLKGDLEGITLAENVDGIKYLVFSDQGASTFHVLPSNGSQTTARFGVAGVTHTDGVDASLANLGEKFPDGLFACHSDDPVCPIVLVPAEDVIEALSGQ